MAIGNPPSTAPLLGIYNVDQVPALGMQSGASITGSFGLGTGTFANQGNLLAYVPASPGIAPGATGADNVLAVYSIPSGSFSASGKTITVSAGGAFAANGNTKRVKLFFNPSAAVVGSTITGGTLLADTGAVTTSGLGWSLSGNIVKYGVAGSNTQLAISGGAIAGAVSVGVTAPVYATATESGAILIAVTGNSTTTANDILLNWLEVNAMN